MPPTLSSLYDCPPVYLIRSVMPQDDERLVAVENAAGRLFAAHGYPQIAEDGFEDAAQLRRTLSGGDMFVAVDAGDLPVGFASTRALQGYLHLRELSVDPAHGRRGLGRALVGAVIAAAQGAGHRGVSLSTFRSVPFNQPFYESLGFRELMPGDAPQVLVSAYQAEIPRGIDPAERVLMRYLLI